MIRTEDRGLVYYQFATLRAEPRVRHGFFTRLGGASAVPYASLNVGGGVGDDPKAVSENCRRIFKVLGFGQAQVVSPHQVHSSVVARAGKAEGGQVIPDADGLLTDERRTALFLRFADCVPLLLYDPERAAIGLVHAGWRGTLEGIAGRAVSAMGTHFGSRPAQLWAGIGPAIGPCCYEVAPDLAHRFGERYGPQVLRCPDTGRPHLDLAGANALALREAGVREVEQAQLCTACRCDEFFSHRREEGRTGRFAVLIGLAADGEIQT